MTERLPAIPTPARITARVRAAHPVPVLVTVAGERASTRFLEFFAANIRNKHTRRAYAQATRGFLAWCERAGVASIADVRPLHVAAYIEQLGRRRSAPTVKQRLAAIRHLFDWLVTGKVTCIFFSPPTEGGVLS